MKNEKRRSSTNMSVIPHGVGSPGLVAGGPNGGALNLTPLLKSPLPEAKGKVLIFKL